MTTSCIRRFHVRTSVPVFENRNVRTKIFMQLYIHIMYIKYIY